MMIDQKLIDRAEELTEKGEEVLRTSQPPQSSPRARGRVPVTVHSRDSTDYGLWTEWRHQSLTFLRGTLGDKHTYSAEFADRCINNSVSCTHAGIGILRAVKQDMEGGYLARLPELVHADVFSDFIEMAEHLLATGYKDAAAVIGGSVLEEHLRLLCDKHGVPTNVGAKPKKADTMNADLHKAGVYDLNQQKIITGWLGIRNSAAHGKYREYTKEQVAPYLSGIREVIARFPA